MQHLPPPDDDALAHSAHLREVIQEQIIAAGGSVPFWKFMELALYAPDLGYYSGGAAKLGKDGDFTTAPEISPLFGATLAHVAAAIMAQTAPRILEFGAGTGKLACDILTEAASAGIDCEKLLPEVDAMPPVVSREKTPK